MVYSPPVTAGWLHSIDRAQSDLMKKAEHITVPVLVMHKQFTRGRMRLDSGVSERGCAVNPQ